MTSSRAAPPSLFVVLVCGLACAGLDPANLPRGVGGLPPDEAIGEPEEPPEAPVATADGLAAVLGLPKQGGELVVSQSEKAEIIHRNAWDVAKVWPLYHEAFLAEGWERMPSNVPPFESLYEKDDRYIDLRMESAGPTVRIAIDRKPRKR